jgi:hypothetical protein
VLVLDCSDNMCSPQAVTCADFCGHFICTGGEDCTVILTSDAGERIASVTTAAVPVEVSLSPCSTAGSATTASQLSISDGKSVYVCSVKGLRETATKDATVQLDFGDTTNQIVHHCWCGLLLNHVSRNVRDVPHWSQQ